MNLEERNGLIKAGIIDTEQQEIFLKYMPKKLYAGHILSFDGYEMEIQCFTSTDSFITGKYYLERRADNTGHPTLVWVEQRISNGIPYTVEIMTKRIMKGTRIVEEKEVPYDDLPVIVDVFGLYKRTWATDGWEHDA